MDDLVDIRLEADFELVLPFVTVDMDCIRLWEVDGVPADVRLDADVILILSVATVDTEFARLCEVDANAEVVF